MNMGRAYRELKPKAPLLAKDARNGEPCLFEGYVENGDVGHPPLRSSTVHAQGRISGKATEVANNFNYPCASSMARSGVARGNLRRLLLKPSFSPRGHLMGVLEKLPRCMIVGVLVRVFACLKRHT